MLPPYIIEQIRKREQEEANKGGAVIQLPIPERRRPIEPQTPLVEEQKRGVVVIDLV